MKYDKKEYNRLKKVLGILVKNNLSWDEIKIGVEQVYTNISDTQNPRMEEFTKKYDVLDLIRSKSKLLAVHFIDKEHLLIAEVFFYNKAPNGLLFFLNQFKRNSGSWHQDQVAIYTSSNVESV